MKMYFLVRNDIPTGFAVNSVAHAAVSAYEVWGGSKDWWDWMRKSFRKVTCGLDANEWERAKFLANQYELECMVITESDYNGEEMVIVFAPRDNWPLEFKEFRLYDGKQ